VRLAEDRGSPGSGETAQLKAEVSRLKVDLQRANEERDILKKAATYFAKLSG
jgi:transposase